MGNLQALSYVFRFNQILRVRSEECKRILELIKNYAVFKTSSNATQHPIKLQLKIVLYRLGSSGDGQSVRKVASLFYVHSLQHGFHCIVFSYIHFKRNCPLQPHILHPIDLSNCFLSRSSNCLPLLQNYSICCRKYHPTPHRKIIFCVKY
nr:uncharacterized protein LOC106623841 isoform X1 [Bactrocera oleae]